MSAFIKAISYYLPSKVLDNEELATQFPEWSVEKIAQKTGITKRHIAADNICSSDLGIESARKLFEEHRISPSDIDFILFCTQSPDYFLPTTACIIQDKLRVPQSAGALDFNLGCSGYIYGLSLARGLVETGQAKNVLLITAETYSKFIHDKDKSVRTLFGDAAASTLVTLSETGSLEGFIFGTDGQGAENLIVKTGGMRQRILPLEQAEVTDEYGNTRDENSLYMNGQEIFTFTLREIPQLVKNIFEKTGFTDKDIDLYIFHQANRYMLDTLRKRLGIDESKFYQNFAHCGNTVSSTIPIALWHALEEGRISQGSRVMLIGFGVGYSWAGCIVQL